MQCGVLGDDLRTRAATLRCAQGGFTHPCSMREHGSSSAVVAARRRGCVPVQPISGVSTPPTEHETRAPRVAPAHAGGAARRPPRSVPKTLPTPLTTAGTPGGRAGRPAPAPPPGSYARAPRRRRGSTARCPSRRRPIAGSGSARRRVAVCSRVTISAREVARDALSARRHRSPSPDPCTAARRPSRCTMRSRTGRADRGAGRAVGTAGAREADPTWLVGDLAVTEGRAFQQRVQPAQQARHLTASW